MKNLNVFLIASICFSVILATPVRAEDDFQYWSRYSIKALDTKYVDFVNFWDLRFMEDSSRFRLWFTSQKILINPVEWFGFVIAHTYLENSAVNSRTKTREFVPQHRFELEANPKWEVTPWLTLKNRNRVEFRWIENKGSDNARMRHMVELEFPIRKNPVVKSIYTNSEFFIDFNRHTINENRAIPIGINFYLYKKSTFGVFYMIQSQKGARDWSSNQILGTQISLVF